MTHVLYHNTINHNSMVAGRLPAAVPISEHGHKRVNKLKLILTFNLTF